MQNRVFVPELVWREALSELCVEKGKVSLFLRAEHLALFSRYHAVGSNLDSTQMISWTVKAFLKARIVFACVRRRRRALQLPVTRGARDARLRSTKGRLALLGLMPEAEKKIVAEERRESERQKEREREPLRRSPSIFAERAGCSVVRLISNQT
jgi:hypothetical protein